MRKHPIIVVALLAAVLVAGTAGVYGYDSGRDDLIARGVSVGSIDVGGLRAAEARTRVRGGLLAPLQSPLVIRAGDRRFELTAREAHIRANVAAMVDEAVDRSRQGSILTRAWRGVSGGEVPARIAPTVSYSKAAVQRLVDKIRVQMTRDPVNAKVDFSTQSLALTPSKSGRSIDARALRAKVNAALVSRHGDRSVQAKLVKVAPKVASEQLAERYPVVVTVDRQAHKLRLFEDLRPSKTFPIALGRAGLETPAGLYNIANKAVDPAWHVPNSAWAGALAGKVIPGGAPDNPIKARWLGVYDGVGVHGTSDRASIGTNASHGCIRMYIEDVKELYDEVPVGAPIFID